MSGLKGQLYVLRLLLLVLVTAILNSKSYGSSIRNDGPMSNSAMASWFKLINSKIRLLERKLEIDFRILSQTLREELKAGARGCSRSLPGPGAGDVSISDVRFEVQTLQMDMRQMAVVQVRMEEDLAGMSNRTSNVAERVDRNTELLERVLEKLSNLTDMVSYLASPTPPPTIPSTTPAPGMSQFFPSRIWGQCIIASM